MTFWLLVSVASLVFCSSVVERRDAALPLSYRRPGLVWFVGGKTRDIALQLVWRQCCKQVALFVALFTLALDIMYSFKYQHFQVPVWSGMVGGDWCSGYSTIKSLFILFFLIWNLSIQNQYFHIPTPGLGVNFLVHLKSFGSKIFFTLANWWDHKQILSLWIQNELSVKSISRDHRKLICKRTRK